MNIQTFYPVFENGQVLTSEHLNDIVDYLEPQDRLSRTRLTGIGIVCGFELDWDSRRRILTLSCGAAVTSAGYLIAEDEVALDRVRPYTVPVPSAPDATAEEKEKARYPFLFDGATQREAFELLPTGFQPAPGEPAPTRLTAGFVADKTVMLFLECNLESLKSCDVNDCSDKGSEMKVTLRRLLVARDIADKILEQEAKIAERPVDRASHPRLGLAPLSVGKLNLARHDVGTLSALYGRIMETAGAAALDLLPAMRAAWEAYKPLLEDMFPPDRFGNGPVPGHHFLNMLAATAETPTLIQYLHGGMRDLVLSYNEFIACAARFDAECCPDPERFPRHALAGDVAARPVAFAKAPSTLDEYAGYDPLAASGGPAPEGTPAPRRHHFVPSPALDAGNDKTAELRSVFQRMILLAQTYFTRGLLDAEIRLTPSRDGAAPLGERAIPFHYRFERTGDLFRNWSWRKARANLLGTVFSYQFMSEEPHPLEMRRDDQDFIRVEGVVGKPLGTAMTELIRQKRELGLSFAIDPVLIGLGEGDEESSELAFRATQQLLLCRVRDLDALFRMLMSALFAFMVWIVRAVGRLDATKATRKPAEPAPAESPAGAFVGVTMQPAMSILRVDPEVRFASEFMLHRARIAREIGSDEVVSLIHEADPEQPLERVAVGSLFARAHDASVGGELIDRVRAAARDLDVATDEETISGTIYPAVALVARAEEMMKVTSAASLTEFDEESFNTAMRGFADAYEQYAARAELDQARSSKAIAETNAAIVASRGMVAAAATQFSGTAITAELGKYLGAMFDEQVLPAYARRHPGLEHKGGVPVGGTFVLIYGTRRAVEAGMRRALAALARTFGAHFAKLVGGPGPQFDVRKAIAEILASSKPQSDDALDEFVVLGDFCLPYLCCDASCGEREVEERITRPERVVRPGSGGGIVTREPVRPEEPVTEPTRPEEPVTGPTDRRPERTGTVEIGVTVRGTARTLAAGGVILTVIDLSTNRPIARVPLRDRTHKMDLPAGKYGFLATAANRRSRTEEIALRAGESKRIRLTIA